MHARFYGIFMRGGGRTYDNHSPVFFNALKLPDCACVCVSVCVASNFCIHVVAGVSGWRILPFRAAIAHIPNTSAVSDLRVTIKLASYPCVRLRHPIDEVFELSPYTEREAGVCKKRPVLEMTESYNSVSVCLPQH